MQLNMVKVLKTLNPTKGWQSDQNSGQLCGPVQFVSQPWHCDTVWSPRFLGLVNSHFLHALDNDKVIHDYYIWKGEHVLW